MRSLTVILIFSASLFGQQYSPSGVLDSIRATYAHMNDASASFTQTVAMRFKSAGQPISGSVKIKKGNKYWIETGSQTIVTDGVTVWMYTPSTQQVLIDQFKINRQPFSPDKFLLGLPIDFSPVGIDKKDNTIMLTLKPSARNKTMTHITSLRVSASKRDWIIDKIEMTDKNATVTVITLSDIRFNKGIDDAQFQFQVTPEMNVVDLKKLQ